MKAWIESLVSDHLRVGGCELEITANLDEILKAFADEIYNLNEQLTDSVSFEDYECDDCDWQRQERDIVQEELDDLEYKVTEAKELLEQIEKVLR